jgi:hypothetical protein
MQTIVQGWVSLCNPRSAASSSDEGTTTSQEVDLNLYYSAQAGSSTSLVMIPVP